MLRLDLRAIGGSALTADIPVPKGRSVEAMGAGIPVTYVPARNTIFLSHALAWAEVLESQDIFIGVNALDYSGYPDCRPEYIEAFERMANLATRAGVEGRSRLRIHTPLIRLTKARDRRARRRARRRLRRSPGPATSRGPTAGLRALRFLPAPRQGLSRGRPARSRPCRALSPPGPCPSPPTS